MSQVQEDAGMVGKAVVRDDVVIDARHEQIERRGVLTERDRMACRWVCEQGAMTVDQLWRAVWWSDASRSPRYAYERVLFLSSQGFLAKLKTPYNLKTYYKGTRSAQESAASAEEGLGLPVPLSAPRVEEIPHTDLLTELRLAVLRSDRLKSWRTDRVLAIDASFPKERFYSHLPDAIWATQSDKQIAVEYERTRKGIARVRMKVEAFSREMARPDRAFDLVVWVAEPGAHRDLEGVLAQHPSQKLRTVKEFQAEMSTAAKT